jgi:hypothetical protein
MTDNQGLIDPEGEISDDLLRKFKVTHQTHREAAVADAQSTCTFEVMQASENQSQNNAHSS